MEQPEIKAYKPNEDDYFVNFSTKEGNGRYIEGVRVTLDMVKITDMNASLNIALCEHPLYRELQAYVKANPR